MSIHTWFVDEAGRMEARKVTAAELRQACEEEFGVKTYTREEVVEAVRRVMMKEDVADWLSPRIIQGVRNTLGPQYQIRAKTVRKGYNWDGMKWEVLDTDDGDRIIAECRDSGIASIVAEALNDREVAQC